MGTNASGGREMPRKRKAAPIARSDNALRERIREATFAVLMERGYAGTGTSEIAARAKVSKRELYALFRDKQAILASCIAERAKQMRLPLELPAARDRRSLVAILEGFGTAALRGVSHPTVTAVFRLAVVEAERSPEVARALDTAGHQATRAALTELLSRAQSAGLLGTGDPSAMAARFFALLWGDLRLRLLLRVAAPPTQAEIKRRAQAATEALLALHAGKRR